MGYNPSPPPKKKRPYSPKGQSRIKIKIENDDGSVDLGEIFEGFDETLNKAFEGFDETIDKAFEGFNKAFERFDDIFNTTTVSGIKINKPRKKPCKSHNDIHCSSCSSSISSESSDSSSESSSSSSLSYNAPKAPKWPEGPEMWEEGRIPKKPKGPPNRIIREPRLGEIYAESADKIVEVTKKVALNAGKKTKNVLKWVLSSKEDNK